jgi:hypothetical protein
MDTHKMMIEQTIFERDILSLRFNPHANGIGNNDAKPIARRASLSLISSEFFSPTAQGYLSEQVLCSVKRFIQ